MAEVEIPCPTEGELVGLANGGSFIFIGRFGSTTD